MTVQVNGISVDLTEEVEHVSDLLRHYQLEADKVVVELNKTIVDKKLHDQTKLQSGDQVELVHFVGGG